MTEDTLYFILESKTDGVLFFHESIQYLALSSEEEVIKRFNEKASFSTELVKSKDIEKILEERPSLEIIDLDINFDSYMTNWEFQDAIKSLCSWITEQESKVKEEES